MKSLKRIVAVLLVVLLPVVYCAIPVQAMAAPDDPLTWCFQNQNGETVRWELLGSQIIITIIRNGQIVARAIYPATVGLINAMQLGAGGGGSCAAGGCGLGIGLARCLAGGVLIGIITYLIMTQPQLVGPDGKPWDGVYHLGPGWPKTVPEYLEWLLNQFKQQTWCRCTNPSNGQTAWFDKKCGKCREGCTEVPKYTFDPNGNCSPNYR